MADVALLAEPGDLTVPLLSGWPAIAVLLLVLLGAVAAAALLGVLRGGRGQRREWQALLDARSGPVAEEPAERDPRPAG